MCLVGFVSSFFKTEILGSCKRAIEEENPSFKAVFEEPGEVSEISSTEFRWDLRREKLKKEDEYGGTSYTLSYIYK